MKRPMNDALHPEAAILSAALDLPKTEQIAYLDKTCAGDVALRRQVEALLQAHELAEGFLNAPPAGLDFSRAAKVCIPLNEKSGAKIGHYKLLQQTLILRPEAGILFKAGAGCGKYAGGCQAGVKEAVCALSTTGISLLIRSICFCPIKRINRKI